MKLIESKDKKINNQSDIYNSKERYREIQDKSFAKGEDKKQYI
jgi:hypothetical protein